jgi:Tfp pilus assembly protein PilF
VGAHDQSSRATTRMALGLVRSAQGRDEEAEQLLREALDVISETDFHVIRAEVLRALVLFLRERGREPEADGFEEQLAELGDPRWGQPTFAESTARIA